MISIEDTTPAIVYSKETRWIKDFKVVTLPFTGSMDT